ADGDERIGLGRACRHDAARAVILEAAADEQPVIGKQCRGERIAGMARKARAVEGEAHGMAAVDEAAGSEAIGGHCAPPLSAAASLTAKTSWVKLSRSTTSQRRHPATCCQCSRMRPRGLARTCT